MPELGGKPRWIRRLDRPTSQEEGVAVKAAAEQRYYEVIGEQRSEEDPIFRTGPVRVTDDGPWIVGILRGRGSVPKIDAWVLVDERTQLFNVQLIDRGSDRVPDPILPYGGPLPPTRESLIKMEFLDGNTGDLPLVRLFGFEPASLYLLRWICGALVGRWTDELDLNEAPWLEVIGNCHFVWRRTEQDRGVWRPADGEPFVLELSREAWIEVDGKISSLEASPDPGYNWLCDEGEIDVLVSQSGRW